MCSRIFGARHKEFPPPIHGVRHTRFLPLTVDKLQLVENFVESRAGFVSNFGEETLINSCIAY